MPKARIITSSNPFSNGRLTKAEQLALWDREALDHLIASLDGKPGLQAQEIVARRLADLKRLENSDVLPEVQGEPMTQRGDLWILGEHRLLCGDSTDADAVAYLVGDELAYLCATDPPYGVDFGVANHNPTAKDWGRIEGDLRQGEALRGWLCSVIGTWLPHVSDDGAWYVWSASLSEGHRFYEAIIDAGLHVQSQVVWVKNVFAMGQADYQWKHEPAWYAFKKGANHRWFGGREQTTTWEVKRDPNAAYLHPTQKPVELFRRSIENHTRAGELCLEPFCGSGSQLIAAEQTGRRCFAMELDAKWCDVAVQRWERFTGMKAERVTNKAR